MARSESKELAALDDLAAVLDQIRESVAIIATRQRGRLTRREAEELSAILSATDRGFGYLAEVREPVSQAYQKKER